MCIYSSNGEHPFESNFLRKLPREASDFPRVPQVADGQTGIKPQLVRTSFSGSLSIILFIYIIFFFQLYWETFNILYYSLIKVYSSGIFSICSILQSSLERVQYAPKKSYTLSCRSPFPLSPAPDNHSPTSCICRFAFSRHFISMDMYSMWPFVSDFFHLHCFKIYSRCSTY